MKRLAAIFLLALLLYNAFGYHLLFAYERHQARDLAIRLTPESHFQVIKIKVALYTSVADTDFEYVDEDLAVADHTYRIVKKRIKNDTAELYYFRDFRQEELHKNLHDILADQTPFQKSDHQSPIKYLVKNFLKDYLPHEEFHTLLNCAELSPVCSKIKVASDMLVLPAHLSINAPPPEMV